MCFCLQEETLLKLQTSVDTEEKRWIQKLQKSSEEFVQVSKLSQLLECFLLVFYTENDFRVAGKRRTSEVDVW